jgi:HEAT repeat protein
MLLALLVCAVEARGNGTLLKQIQDKVVTIRTGKSPNIRGVAAEQLALITAKIKSSEVDDKTFADLVSLLDSSDDAVRMGVAGALGFLGARAKPAVPKLLELLPKVDCLDGSITSADSIRLALKRIGVTPPPPPDCIRRGG